MGAYVCLSILHVLSRSISHLILLFISSVRQNSVLHIRFSSYLVSCLDDDDDVNLFVDFWLVCSRTTLLI